MMLVDTTVWVDYFNGRRSPHTDYLDMALGSKLILIGDIILAEVLQGFRADGDFQTALERLSHFDQVSLVSAPLAVQSARNYRYLRQRGITIRKTIDCFIATYCTETGCPLLHCDRDFDPFEAHLGLSVIHPEDQGRRAQH